jgi:hypothetical protein
MIPRDPFVSAFEEWRGLTEVEGGAIERSDWPCVASCQARKKSLQAILTNLSRPLRATAGSANPIPADLPAEVRALVAELVALETRNASLLAAKRQAALVERVELDRAGINLRRVRGSYGGPSPARRRFDWSV